jgi:hypothetical protein
LHEHALSHALVATDLPARRLDGRLSPRAINLLLEQIGRWHDAELPDARRQISGHMMRAVGSGRYEQAVGARTYG